MSKDKKENEDPPLLMREYYRMSPEQRDVERARVYYKRHPKTTNFKQTEDPRTLINIWPKYSRPQPHALGSRIFVNSEDKAIQQVIEEKFQQQYGSTELKTWDLFPLSRKDFEKMKAQLEAAENDPDNLHTINVLPSIYLDEEWLTKAELFEPTRWEIFKEKMGIETPIETIDVLAKEKAELDEWRKKQGLFQLPPNYREILRLDPEDVWSKEQEEKAIDMIRQSFPTLSDDDINQVRDEARRRASQVAQVWNPLIYGPDSSSIEAAIDYNLRDLSWVPNPRGFTEEKRKEMDWYMETEIRKILQGIGHFTELELGPAPEPPDSIKHKFHLTPEQYMYYKSYFEDDPVAEFSASGSYLPPEYFPKLKTEDEKSNDPYGLGDIDLKRYHQEEYRQELAEKLTQFAQDTVDRQDLIATFKNYGMTLRKDENEVYLKRMQQDPFYDEDARDRVEIDERFKKPPWRDQIEDYDEDLVDVPAVMLPEDPLRSPNLPLDETNAPFDLNIIPLDVQKKMQSGEQFVDSVDMLWPVNNYYNESGFDPRELEETDVDTYRQLLLNVFPKAEVPHYADEDRPPYNPNSTERKLLERAEALYHHYRFLKKASAKTDLWNKSAFDEPTFEQKLGSEPMPTETRKHPVFEYVDLMTSAANKIWYDEIIMEPRGFDFLPILQLGEKTIHRIKLKEKDEKIREYAKNEPIMHKRVEYPQGTMVPALDIPANEMYTYAPVKPQIEEIQKGKKAKLEQLAKKVDKEQVERNRTLDDLLYQFEVHKNFQNPGPLKGDELDIPDPLAQLTLEDFDLVPYKEQIELTIQTIESHHSIPWFLNYIQLLSTKYGIDKWNLEQLYAAAEISTVVLLTPLRMMRIQSFVSPSAKARFRSALRWIPFSPSVTTVLILKKLIKWGLRAMGMQTIIYFPIACFTMNLMDNLSTNVLIRNTDPITAAVEMYREYGWRALIRGLPWKILSSTADVVMDYFTEGHVIFHWIDSKYFHLVTRLWPWSQPVLERVQEFAYGIAKRLVLSPFSYFRYRSYVSDPNRIIRRRTWPSALSVIALVPVSLIEYTIRFFIKSTVVPYIALANPTKVLDYSQKWAPGTGPVRIHTPLYPSWEQQLYSSKYWDL